MGSLAGCRPVLARSVRRAAARPPLLFHSWVKEQRCFTNRNLLQLLGFPGAEPSNTNSHAAQRQRASGFAKSPSLAAPPMTSTSPLLIRNTLPPGRLQVTPLTIESRVPISSVRSRIVPTGTTNLTGRGFDILDRDRPWHRPFLHRPLPRKGPVRNAHSPSEPSERPSLTNRPSTQSALPAGELGAFQRPIEPRTFRAASDSASPRALRGNIAPAQSPRDTIGCRQNATKSQTRLPGYGLSSTACIVGKSLRYGAVSSAISSST